MPGASGVASPRCTAPYFSGLWIASGPSRGSRWQRADIAALQVDAMGMFEGYRRRPLPNREEITTSPTMREMSMAVGDHPICGISVSRADGDGLV